LNPKDPELKDSRLITGKSGLTRRELLQQAMIAAAFLPQGFPQGRPDFPGGWGGWGRGRRRPPRTVDPSQIPAYKYQTLSVSRFPSLQSEFNAARNSSQLSRNKVFRDQINSLDLKLPGNFPNAKSVVVIAVYSKNMYANFQLDGSSHRVMIPFQYYNDDLNSETLKGVIQKDIIKTPGRQIVDVSQYVPLKLLAARSGLGRYARNGLIFVDGMGSYNVLYAFLTDHTLADNWTNLDILNECNHCHACVQSCPTNCISRWGYGVSINIDKCLTLYNENLGEFPNWILGSMHHALMGCMRCKSPCPVNEGIAELSGKMEDVSEEETRKILKGTADETLLRSLQRKLRQFRAVTTKDQFPIMSRNLKALIRV
jgi:epoxyqueuosine reductase